MAKHSQYGVILDAGSSGTRVYVYKWKDPQSAAKKHPSDLNVLPKLKLVESQKIHPGISTFAEDVSAVGDDHLRELMETAIKKIPASKIKDTPVFLMATAGVRFLPKQQQNSLLHSVCAYLKEETEFQLPDCDAHVQVISGETEGLYGWIAANYLLGGFDEPQSHNHGKNHHTYGFLDMGGASAQIAFAPNSTEAEKHANDLKLVRMRHLDGSTAEYKVFTATWLGFGANKARERYVEKLKSTYDETAVEIPDGCLPKGLKVSLTGEIVEGKAKLDENVLIGTGLFQECLRATHPLLEKDAPCSDQPCLLNGQHVPAIDFDVNHFVGVSEYWHTTHGVFGKSHNAYDLARYQHDVMDFCSRDWSSITSDLTARKKTLEEKKQDAKEACFKASWLINMLYEGIGIPRLGLEHVPSPGINTTKETVEGAKDKGFLDSFQPVDKIDGIEVTWTLGKMVLYAAGQVPPTGSELPVGFGSNVASGTPKDFEHAGSSPIVPGTTLDDDEDDEDVFARPAQSTSGLLVFVLILFAIGYFLRKPERRHKLLSKFRRYRKSSNGRRRKGSSILDKLLGRSKPAYERVMEEGDAPEFELGGMDSDENDQSDSTDGSGTGRASGMATPKLNVERFEEGRPPSAMDRTGLVVRTESRERLAPTLQMLNAGRRSRHGSPTRQKSPLKTSLEDA